MQSPHSLSIRLLSALAAGDFEGALRFAENALRVDEENVYALVLSGAVYTLQDKTAYVDRLRRYSQNLLPGFPFEHRIDLLLNRFHPTRAVGD